jgi:hypothetical protein
LWLRRATQPQTDADTATNTAPPAPPKKKKTRPELRGGLDF